MSIARRLTTTALAAILSLAAAAALPLSASAAGTGALTVTNLDVLPDNSRVVMNKIQTPADSSQRMHDKVTLQLKNTGTAGVTVSSLATTGAFTLTSPYQLPFTLTSGSSANLTVSFTATSGDWHTGTAKINWTNGTSQSTSLGLTGWWQKYSEHGLEPHLNDLVKNFGYGTVMPTAIYSRGAYKAFSTDEVLSPYWKLLDSTKPAQITQIAAWRGYPSNVVVSKFAKGGTQNYQVFSGLKNDAQSAYPRNTSWTRGTASFSAGGTIGLKVDNEYTDPKLNDSSVDRAAGCTATQCGQHLRVFKVRTPSGTLVPGAYLMAQDFGGINYDYNDNVFLLQNLAPA
jgi:hypothetical protein